MELWDKRKYSEKIMYYAHDDKGYYFVEYDTKSGTMGEKQYNDSLDINSA